MGKKLTTVLLFIALLLITSNIFSQDTLQDAPADLTSSIGTSSNSQLQERIAELEKQVESDQLIDWVKTLIVAIIGGLIVWAIQRPVKQRYKEIELDVDKRLENLLKEKERVIANTFEKTRLEESLKKNVKFRVIGLRLPGTDLYGILKVSGIDMRNETEGEDYDLLIINNEQNKGLKITREGDPSTELADALQVINHMSDEQVAFYYNNTRVQFPNDQVEGSIRGRINFATNASQVYGNLLSSLIYQHSLRKST